MTLDRIFFFLLLVGSLEVGSVVDVSAQRGHGGGGASAGRGGMGGGMSFPHGSSMSSMSYRSAGTMSSSSRVYSGSSSYRYSSPSYSRSVASGRVSYHGDRYYRFSGGRYVDYYPIGFHLGTLSWGYFRFWIGLDPYFYYDGVYYIYRETERTYEVVKPPLGALVETLPEGCDKLVIDGETFYILGGVQYKPVIVDGTVWYKVIKVN